MPHNIYVQLRDLQAPCIVPGSKVDEGTQTLTITNAKDEVVGKFHADAVVGWWIQLD